MQLTHLVVIYNSLRPCTMPASKVFTSKCSLLRGFSLSHFLKDPRLPPPSKSQTTFARMEAKSCVWHTSGGPEGISAGLAPDLVEDQNQMNRDVDSLK